MPGAKKNPRFKELLKDTKEVSEDNLEGIIALKPDLIIALNTVKDKEKLEKNCTYCSLYIWKSPLS